jgi:hypothetical protein
VTLAVVFFMLAADLSSVSAEPDLSKRSELALANADHQIDAAREAYRGGDLSKMNGALDEVRDSVNLSVESLEQTHKHARNNKYYKRAELKVRALMRRLSSFRDEVALEDRKLVEAVHQRLQEVHDKLIADIMSKK